MKHILFILPEYYEIPIGGYKVVFEYSNRLIMDGYKVTIVYPYFLMFWKSSVKRKLKMCFYFLYYQFFKRKSTGFWFPLNKRVKNVFVFTLSEKFIPQADSYIATAMETAIYLNQYKKIKPENKHYLIQAVEDWQWGKNAAFDTWKLPLKKIVVSDWLKTLAEGIGENPTVIENGVDRPGFSCIIPIQERNNLTIMMLYHKQKLKGCEDGIEALRIVRKKYPDLHPIFFGAPSKPPHLPHWIEYHSMPSEKDLNHLYNQASIFLGTSHSEGFGLTVGEAMLCGCSVVCTDAGGYLTMAKHQETALVCKVGDSQGLAKNIELLIENTQLRYDLAENANKFIQRFTWEAAYKKFKLLFS